MSKKNNINLPVEETIENESNEEMNEIVENAPETETTDVENTEVEETEGETIENESNEEMNEIVENDSETKKYIVIYPFKDLCDFHHIYRVGDIYPHNKPIEHISPSRISELTTKNNKIGKVLIKLDME